MMPVRLETATPRSQVKHSTTEPLRLCKICDVMTEGSHRCLLETAIIKFQALFDQTNPSGGSYRRLFGRDIINLQALTDGANH